MGLIIKHLNGCGVEAIEREIIQKYNNYHRHDSNDDVLLSLRKDIINKNMLSLSGFTSHAR